MSMYVPAYTPPPSAGGSGGGAPTDAQYVVGAANGSLSAEIVASAFALTLLDDADAATARSTLGIAVSLLADSTLGADAASFDFQSLATTHKHVVVVAALRGADSAGLTSRVRFNNDSGNNYGAQRLFGNNATVTASAEASQSSGRLGIPTDGRY